MQYQQLKSEIAIILLESIIQTRINVNHEQINKFNAFVRNIQAFHQKSYKVIDLILLIKGLIMQQKTQARQLINSADHQHIILLQFSFVKNEQHHIIHAQTWEIQLSQFLAHYCPNTTQMVINLFHEIILLLNDQPLFIEYRKNTLLKNHYTIQYNLTINSKTKNTHKRNYLKQTKSGQQLLKLNLINFPSRKFYNRASRAYEINIKTFSMKHLEQVSRHDFYKLQNYDYQKNITKELQKRKTAVSMSYSLSQVDDIQDFIGNDSEYIQLNISGINESYDINEGNTIIVMENSCHSLHDDLSELQEPSNSRISKNNIYENNLELLELQRILLYESKKQQEEFEVLELNKDQKLFWECQALLKQFTEIEKNQQNRSKSKTTRDFTSKILKNCPRFIGKKQFYQVQ